MDEEQTTPAEGSETLGSWRLPEGIEDHIESGLIKSVVGATAGGILGFILFRSGKGTRAASISAGVGVAVGSTYERFMASQKSS